jgi:membrane associated rhomboid family serine protease
LFPIRDNIPTGRFPFITVLIIAINVAVFIFFQHPTGFNSVDNEKVVKYGAIPYELTHPGKECGDGTVETTAGPAPAGGVVCEGKTYNGVRVTHVPGKHPSAWLTVLTAMFMHGGFLHIFGNMLFLWIFGNNVEDAMGRVRFVAFYLLGGLAALALQVAVGSGSDVPTIGASGAIAAVLGGYLLLYPRARVVTIVFLLVFFAVVELPAIAFLGIWFAQQIVFGAADLTNPTGGGGGVAYFAHIGGFAFGLLAIKLFAARRKEPEPRLPVY